MFNENDYNGSASPNQEPAQTPAQTPDSLLTGAPDSQPMSGSYYSPRSGYSEPGSNPPDGGDEPPKKKQHKGLKALAVFASIAFLSYASIQCYQFATENEALRKFFAKDSSSVSERLISENNGSDGSSAEDSGDSTVSGQELANTESSAGSSVMTAQNWLSAAAREDALSLPDIVDKVMPATVGVASTFVYNRPSYSIWGFGSAQTTESEMNATGTGIIMSEDGYVITNAHVIYDSSSQYQMGLAKSVQVVLNADYYEGETQLEAEVVGYDVAEDIAVLKVDTNQKLTVAEFGDSDSLRVGEMVVAIGNPLGFDLFGSVSAGIVSALNREITINENTMKLIQTDTAINSGNSGGPLINSYGQVIGINSSKLSSNYYNSDEASIEGLCFAIPITHAKDIISNLIDYGYVRGKPLIGITTRDISEETSEAYGIPVGVLVRDVTPNGAADLAGVKPGDVVIAINGESVSTYAELNRIKDQFKAGDTITLTVTRSGQDLEFTLVLQEKNPNLTQ